MEFTRQGRSEPHPPGLAAIPKGGDVPRRPVRGGKADGQFQLIEGILVCLGSHEGPFRSLILGNGFHGAFAVCFHTLFLQNLVIMRRFLPRMEIQCTFKQRDREDNEEEPQEEI